MPSLNEDRFKHWKVLGGVCIVFVSILSYLKKLKMYWRIFSYLENTCNFIYPQYASIQIDRVMTVWLKWVNNKRNCRNWNFSYVYWTQTKYTEMNLSVYYIYIYSSNLPKHGSKGLSMSILGQKRIFPLARPIC